jgi:hypothetical protein
MEPTQGIMKQDFKKMAVSLASIPPECLIKFEDCECENGEKAIYFHEKEDIEVCPLGTKQFLYCESCSVREKHKHLEGKIYKTVINEGFAWKKLVYDAITKKESA